MKEYINQIWNQLRGLKKKYIIITIVVFIILITIITVIGYIQEESYKKKIKNNEYESSSDFKTAKEYLIYTGNEYIKEEESEEENIETDIYVKFAINLYEGEESNKEFFTDLVNIVANTLSYSNYRLIDQEKNLIITVISNMKEQTVTHIYYNGVENYFSIEDSEKSLKNHIKNEGRNCEINSTTVKQLIGNDWSISKMKFGNKREVKNDYLVYDKFMVRNITTKIYNIVFFKNYQEPIINNIKVGTSQDEIKQKLGEPDYEYSEIIGYKTKDIYIFFGTETVSVYRVENSRDGYEDFVKLVQEFRDNRNSRQLVAKLTDIWDDYNYFKVEDNYIDIQYALRGVKIQFNVTEEHGIILYNNYNGEIEKGLNIVAVKDRNGYQLPKYTYVYADEDLVLEAEIDRAFEFEEIGS